MKRKKKDKKPKPPVVFLCLADSVFEGQQTMASDVQRRVLDVAE